MPVARPIQEHLQALCRAGCTCEVMFSDRSLLGPAPVLSVLWPDADHVEYTWLADDRYHGHSVDEASLGDDGEVVLVVDGNNLTLTYQGIWDAAAAEALSTYVADCLAGRADVIAVPGGVRYAPLAAL